MSAGQIAVTIAAAATAITEGHVLGVTQMRDRRAGEVERAAIRRHTSCARTPPTTCSCAGSTAASSIAPRTARWKLPPCTAPSGLMK